MSPFVTTETLISNRPSLKAGRRRSVHRAYALSLAAALIVATTGSHAGSPTPANGASDLPAKAVHALDAIFDGPHKNARAVHAKGLLCAGTFVPTAAARDLSIAEHFAAPQSPVLVRFSNFSGVPNVADNDPMASPRGMAIKFKLNGGGDTDIVAHSYNGFPAATPAEFVEFLTAVGSPDQAAMTTFLASHAAARAFINDPKPPPASYGTESFFGVNAFRFTNATGLVRYGRYRLIPLAGSAHLTEAAAAAMPANYLASEIADRFAAGPIRFRLDVQIAGPHDQTSDGSVPWAADRPVIDAGTLTLTGLVVDGDAIARTILFTPLNLVDGVLPSDDPMLTARSRSYRISQMRRSEQSASAQNAAATATMP